MKKLFTPLLALISINIAAQNVGIGTTAPLAPLHVITGVSTNEALRLESSEPYVSFFNGGSYIGYIQAKTTSMEIASIGARPIHIKPADNVTATFLSNGYVGIGTPNPLTKLHITGSSYDVANTHGDMMIGSTTYGLRIGVSIESSPLTPGRVFMLAAGPSGKLSLGQDANVTLLNLSEGKIGIGTELPQAKLDVFNSSLGYDARFGHNTCILGIDGEDIFQNGSVIQSANPGNSTYRNLFLQPYGGNTGVGTLSPATLLHVYNNNDMWHAFIGGATGRLQFGGQTASGAVIQSFNPDASLPRDLYLQRDGGNVGIGNTNPAARLHVTGAQQIDFISGTTPQLMLSQSDGNYARLGFRNTTGRSWTFAAYRGNLPGNDQLNFYNEQSAADRFVFFGNGNAIFSGVLTQNSDERLKKNIRPVTGVLQQLDNVHAYTYNWSDESRGDDTQLGFLAQEIEKEFPELVRTDNKGYKTVAYQNMVPVLLQAIKELKAELDELKKKR